MKRLRAVVQLEDQKITKEKIEEIISIIDPGNIPTSVLVERILTTVGEKYGVSVEDLKSKTKTASVANARHIAIYLIRKETNMSFKDIGKIFGGRDHTTIMASFEKIEINIKTVKNEETKINELIKLIRG